MTASTRRKLVGGNWKMNGRAATADALVAGLREALSTLDGRPEVVVFPAAPYLARVSEATRGSAVQLGAQDVSALPDGAHTGDVSAAMLLDVGCRWVLVGHSERRADHDESDDVVAAKLKAALDAGLNVMVCVGEPLDVRESGATESFVGAQIDAVRDVLAGIAADRFAIAYEPVWAIGTGRTATSQQAQQTHAFIRQRLGAHGAVDAATVRIVYGGSVKASNAAELFAQPDVDGGLVGGASLQVADFAPICIAAAAR